MTKSTYKENNELLNMKTPIISLDGIKIKLEVPDLDGDGTTGGLERVNKYPNLNQQEIIQPTEMGETLKELNEDIIDEDSRMSSIDMKSRLHYIEVSPLLAIDTLVSLRFLPISVLNFTRQKKRLSVSQGGLGRKEMVEIVAGKREADEKKQGFMGKMFGMKPQQKIPSIPQ